MYQILIIKTHHLGDTLRTSIILEGLKEKYKDCVITWVTSNVSKPLLKYNPLINYLYVENEIHNLKGNLYDIIISLEEDKKLLEVIHYYVKSIRLIQGTYLQNGEVKYTNCSKEWYDMSLISRFDSRTADFLKMKNCRCQGQIYYDMLDLEWKNKPFKTYYSKENAEEYLPSKLDKTLPTVGIVLNAGKSWIMKSLYFDQNIKIVENINKLMNNKVNIILLSEDYQKDYSLYSNLLNHTNNVQLNIKCDLNKYINIIDKCDVLLTPDSLATHIGIGLNKYIVCYFTITSYDEINLFDKGKKVFSVSDRTLSYYKKEDSRPNCVDKLDLDEISHYIVEGIKKC